MTDRNLAGSGRDDSDLNDEPATPSQSGSSGGTLAIDIGSEDEEKTALGADPQPRRATEENKVHRTSRLAPTMTARRADDRERS